MTGSQQHFALETDAIRRAFSDDPLPEKVAPLYQQLLERTKDAADINRRAVLSLLLVAGSAELLNRAAISGLQLGPFEVTDLSAIRLVLPLVAAYLVYDITTTTITATYSRRLLGQINRTYRPSLYKHQYARLTYPLYSSLFGPPHLHESRTITYKLVRDITAILRLGSMLTPLALITHWYLDLFRTFGPSNILLWISVVVAGGFVVFSILLLFEATRSNLIANPLGNPGSRRDYPPL